MKLSCLVALLATTTVVNGFVKKEIPEHLQKKYGLIDPTKDNRVMPEIDLSKLKPKPRDVTRKKNEHEIPRVNDEHYTQEEIPHNEHNHKKEHIDEGEKLLRITLAKAELKE